MRLTAGSLGKKFMLFGGCFYGTEVVGRKSHQGGHREKKKRHSAGGVKANANKKLIWWWITSSKVGRWGEMIVGETLWW